MKSKQIVRKLLLVLLSSLSFFSFITPVHGYFAADQQQYKYDDNGRLIQIDSRSGRLNMQYDLQGNLLSRIDEANLNGRYGATSSGAAYNAEQQYGSTQGLNNWYYQQWDGKIYTNLTYKNGQWAGKTAYTFITSRYLHPDETDAVRKWVAPKAGLIRITGIVAKYDAGGGDGVIAGITKNNNKLWSQMVAYNDTIGYEVDLMVGVRAGDAIYFSVNKNGDNSYDSTFWAPVITYTEAHSAELEYGTTQGLNNWYYQQWDGKAYSDLTYSNGQWIGKTPYTIIFGNFQHPDETDAVRKWVAPKSGLIRIAGNVAKSNADGGDGIVASVAKNDIKLWSQKIAYNDTAGYEVDLTVGVNAGDAIYFVVNKNGDTAYDGTLWSPVIGYLDAHSSEQEYTSIQGHNNWYYQQWDGQAYSDLTFKNGRWEGKTSYTIITYNFQHPDETDAVRKWVAPKAGLIRIAGNVAKYDAGGGDGVIASISKNSSKLWTQAITYNDTAGYEVGLTVGVNAGDAIYFSLNKNGDATYDGTVWTPVIAYMEAYWRNKRIAALKARATGITSSGMEVLILT